MSERHHPSQVKLPPFYPDTVESRRGWARYHDCITLMDRQVGELLDQLEEDQLADDTIVFFYADHGMGMPRGKRCLQDSGLRVPLLVRFPPKWSHFAPSASGTSSDRLVSFVDFAPTVIHLCGLKIPSHFQGTPFLGPHLPSPRTFVYGARDRVDEAFDVARSVRDGRWLYIRNFMPHLPWMQPEAYSDTSTFRQELKLLHHQHQLDAIAEMYASAPRPQEELYDTRSDFYQTSNLAKLPEYRSILDKMRSELRRWQLETRDAGFWTEPQMWERLEKHDTPWDVAQHETRYPLHRLLEAAGAVGRDDQLMKQREWLQDKDDGVRYWAAVGFQARSSFDEVDRKLLIQALSDRSAEVRIEVASALCARSDPSIAIPALAACLRGQSLETALHAARALELLGPIAAPAHREMQAALERAREAENAGDAFGMFLRFSLEAALQ